MLTSVFLVCAAVGGTILAIQFLLLLLGLGGDALQIDVPHDVGHGMGGDFGHDFAGDMHGDAAGGDGDGGGDGAGHAEATGHAYPTGHAATTSEHGSGWLFGILSFRTLVAAVAFFGLAGMTADSARASTATSLLVALAAGAGAMFGVYGIMRGLYGLRAEGTARVIRAVGSPASVYVRIPAQRGGAGKIQINLQNRTMEYEAVTSGAEIPSGARVVVVDIVAPDTVEVRPISEPERNDHE
jgi:hypothetical protein